MKADTKVKVDVISTIRSSENPILKILDNDKLCRQISTSIYDSYSDKNAFLSDGPKLEQLSLHYDYRLIAIYLWAQRNNKLDLLNAFDKLLQLPNVSEEKGKCLHQLAYRRFKNMKVDDIESLTLSFTDSIDDILSFRVSGILIYLFDKTYKNKLITLIKNLGGNLSRFVDQQLDVPSRNAAIRQGDVKQWNFPNGISVISKKRKLDKVEKFKREQLNYYKITKKVPKLRFVIKEQKVCVRIARPFALINDGYAGNVYALFEKMPGISLEEILYNEKDKYERKKYLIHFQLIMEALYARGIWWGDMSPRNILVYKSSSRLQYTLIDFEKTKIFKDPISTQKKIEHWRGQMFIEELCVICPLEEILGIFSGYFNPLSWNMKSQKPVRFKLRPDISNLLKSRKVKSINLGDYNTLDKKILDVRKPHVDPKTRKQYYPGTIGFKVEHYLSSIGEKSASDYDRKTTEVLLAAQEHKVFAKIAQILLRKATCLENKLVELEFESLLESGPFEILSYPDEEVSKLKKALDTLYMNRNDHSFYLNFLRKGA